MFGGCPLTIEMYGPINVPGEGGLLGVLIRHLGTPAFPRHAPSPLGCPEANRQPGIGMGRKRTAVRGVASPGLQAAGILGGAEGVGRGAPGKARPTRGEAPGSRGGPGRGVGRCTRAFRFPRRPLGVANAPRSALLGAASPPPCSSRLLPGESPACEEDAPVPAPSRSPGTQARGRSREPD